jgi:hypothetical protein
MLQHAAMGQLDGTQADLDDPAAGFGPCHLLSVRHVQGAGGWPHPGPQHWQYGVGGGGDLRELAQQRTLPSGITTVKRMSGISEALPRKAKNSNEQTITVFVIYVWVVGPCTLYSYIMEANSTVHFMKYRKDPPRSQIS